MPRRLIRSSPPVFVYGTLRPGAHGNPVAARLRREAAHLGPARVRGRLYRVHWYPGLVPDPDASCWVTGDLFALPPRGDLLAALDAFERYRPAQPRRGDFRRALHEVDTASGPVRAWVYAYHGPVQAGTLIGSGDFLAR